MSVNFEAERASEYRKNYLIRCDFQHKLHIKAFKSLDSNITSLSISDAIYNFHKINLLVCMQSEDYIQRML